MRVRWIRVLAPLAGVAVIVWGVSSNRLLAQSISTTEPSGTSAQRAPADQRGDRMEWWRDARFGMFIHWGLYAVPAGQWKGQPIGGIGEWIKNSAHIPNAEYDRLAGQFDPVRFNAEEWVRTAREAGMRYLVITSKHHDGFCMFHSGATRYNIVDASPWHKDPLAALSRACRRQGVRFCVYYSIMDWHHPSQAPADDNPDHPTYNPTHFRPGGEAQYLQYMKDQLRELVTQYHPGVIWFDGGWMHGWTQEDGKAIVDYLHQLDPLLLINNRANYGGDYGTPEQQIPATGTPGRDWETCMTINDTWGFKRDDNHWKSAESLIRNLIDIASKGGNYLLNVGPTAEGVIPEPEVQRLSRMGQWLKVNGQAIYGAAASPFADLPWGRCTRKGSTLYLHVFDWPTDGRLLVPLKNTVTRAYLLADPRKPLPHSSEGGHLQIQVPAGAPDPIASVVAIQIQGSPDVDNTQVSTTHIR